MSLNVSVQNSNPLLLNKEEINFENSQENQNSNSIIKSLDINFSDYLIDVPKTHACITTDSISHSTEIIKNLTSKGIEPIYKSINGLASQTVSDENMKGKMQICNYSSHYSEYEKISKKITSLLDSINQNIATLKNSSIRIMTIEITQIDVRMKKIQYRADEAYNYLSYLKGICGKDFKPTPFDELETSKKSMIEKANRRLMEPKYSEKPGEEFKNLKKLSIYASAVKENIMMDYEVYNSLYKKEGFNDTPKLDYDMLAHQYDRLSIDIKNQKTIIDKRKDLLVKTVKEFEDFISNLNGKLLETREAQLKAAISLRNRNIFEFKELNNSLNDQNEELKKENPDKDSINKSIEEINVRKDKLLLNQKILDQDITQIEEKQKSKWFGIF